jgi:hypothetical protein
MIIFIVAVLFFICVLAWTQTSENSDLGLFSRIATAITGIMFFTALLAWPLEYYDTISRIKQYEAFRDTVSEARQSTTLSEYERAAILTKITAWNEEIADARYWNDTIFDCYIPDEFVRLPYLR